MSLFFIRYTKIIFCYLQLHRVFGFFSGFFLNAFYLTRLSKFIYYNKHIEINDFPAKWDYDKRYPLYKGVLEKECGDEAINYLEFGVASGASFKWFLQQNKNNRSRFYGFDTFDGLPEDYGPYKKGAFSTQNKLPEINDERGKFYQGLFQQTLPAFLKNFNSNEKMILMMDADLYSATLYVLSTLSSFLKKGDIIFFDQFAVPKHEFRAYLDFTQSYYKNLKLIAAANNYYFVAFKVM
jgi:O-methyltransferase